MSRIRGELLPFHVSRLPFSLGTLWLAVEYCFSQWPQGLSSSAFLSKWQRRVLQVDQSDQGVELQREGLALLLDLGHTEEKPHVFLGAAWAACAVQFGTQQAMFRNRFALFSQPLGSIHENNKYPP